MEYFYIVAYFCFCFVAYSCFVLFCFVLFCFCFVGNKVRVIHRTTALVGPVTVVQDQAELLVCCDSDAIHVWDINASFKKLKKVCAVGLGEKYFLGILVLILILLLTCFCFVFLVFFLSFVLYYKHTKYNFHSDHFNRLVVHNNVFMAYSDAQSHFLRVDCSRLNQPVRIPWETSKKRKKIVFDFDYQRLMFSDSLHLRSYGISAS